MTLLNAPETATLFASLPQRPELGGVMDHWLVLAAIVTLWVYLLLVPGQDARSA